MELDFFTRIYALFVEVVLRIWYPKGEVDVEHRPCLKGGPGDVITFSPFYGRNAHL